MARPVISLVPPPPPKPEIKITHDIQTMTDNAIKALAADPRNYQRSGQLVHVVETNTKNVRTTKTLERTLGVPVIKLLERPTIKDRLSFDVRWLAYRNGEWHHAAPPTDVVAALHTRGQWPGMRYLSGVSTHPCLRPDLTVLQTPGYDAQTGILYRPNDLYPEVREKPDRDDALACLKALREVVCDYPFAAPCHEAAWVAGILTMLARPAIDGSVPMFAVDATTRGTGKSRMVDAAVLICHGEIAARMILSRDDEEMRKKITMLLVEGIGAVLIDNVSRKVESEALDALFTSPGDWLDRILGVTGSARVPARSVWWMTGNNLQLGGDLSRRAIHIRLESTLENPEERSEFLHKRLLQWVRAERKRLVACGLTMLRAAAVAGVIPCATGLWGSYEEWSAIVPATLTWLGMANVLDARATEDEAMNEDKQTIGALIDGLKRLCPVRDGGPQPISARSIVDVLYPQGNVGPGPDGYDALRDAIEAETRTPTGRRPEVRRFGKWLQRVRGRIVSGWRVARHSGANNMAVWCAEPSKEPSPT